MRIYLTRKGKYAGEHIIYDSVEEFRKYHPDAKLWRWSIDNHHHYKIGDFVQCEDGFVVPLLSVYEFRTKNGISRTHLYKFPQGTYGVYDKKDGTIKYPAMKAWLSNVHASSVGGKQSTNQKFGKGTKEVIERKKRRFAILIGQGIDMHKAYFLIFTPFNYITPSTVEYKISELLRDQTVLEELSEFMNPLLEKLQSTFNEERIVEELDNLIKESAKGSTTKRDNIEFVLKLMNTLEKREADSQKELPANQNEKPPLLGTQL